MRLYYLIFSILSLLITFIYIYEHKDRNPASFTVIQVLSPVVCIAAYIRSGAVTLEQAIFANDMIYLACCYIIPLAFLGLALLCNIKVSRLSITMILALNTLVYLSLIFNERLGGIFYKKTEIATVDGYTVLLKEYGIMHTIAYILAFGTVAVTFVMLIYTAIKNRRIARRYIYIVLSGFTVAAVLFVLGRVIHVTTQETTSVYVLIQLIILILVQSMSYYKMDGVIINAMGKGQGVGSIVFSERRRLFLCNEKAEEWFPELKNLRADEVPADPYGINPRFSEWFDRVEKEGQFYEIVKSGDRSIRFDVASEKIEGRNFICFALTDDTAHQELLRVLSNDIEKVRGTFNQYIEPRLAKELLDKNGGTTRGKEFNIAIMFADLRDFTAVSEELGSQHMVDILNKYLSMAEKAIHKYGGILDKYMGDAVMAYWIDAKGDGEAARNAARAAVEIQNSMIEIEDDIFGDISRELFYGIGLNFGRAVLGAVGSEKRKDYTVIGDSVNVASRVESIAPKNTIFITKAFKDAAGDCLVVEESENKIRIKGKAAPLDIYELKGISSVKEQKGENGSPLSVLDRIVSVSEEGQRAPVLYICGCRGSYPVSGVRFSRYGGATTCFIIKNRNHAIVIDCGTGFFDAGPYLKGCTRIDVLLTHLHYDHCIGLLKWNVFPKDAELTFYGNFDEWYGGKSISELFRPPFWPIDLSKGRMIPLPKDDTEIVLSKEIVFRSFDAHHPNSAKLFILDVCGVKLAIMGDCESTDSVPLRYLKNMDYMIYDGMFDDSEYLEHRGWGHSTWQEAIRTAEKTGVRHLIISHHDVNSTDAILRNREQQARLMFPAVVFAKTGDRYELV